MGDLLHLLGQLVRAGGVSPRQCRGHPVVLHQTLAVLAADQGVDHRANSSFQLLLGKVPLTDGIQLGQDGLLGHAELGKFHPRRHHHQPLHLIQHGGGEIAKAHLLPHIGKQLGVGGAAVQGVAHQQRRKLGMVHHHPAGAEAQGQLALGDIHRISDLPHLAALGTVHHLAHHRGLSGREQRSKRAGNGLLHPLHIGRTTIIKSNTAGLEQSPIMVPQLLGRHAAGGLGIPQLVHRIGLLGAHLLYQPEDGPAPLVVDPGSNAVGQIGPLAGHKIPGKHPVLRVRVQ